MFSNFLGTQINDLVSQIKVPVTLPSQPVSKTLLTTNSAGPLQGNNAEKRRKIELVNQRQRTTSNQITLVNNSQQTKAARRLLTTTNNAVTTQIVVEDSSVRSSCGTIGFTDGNFGVFQGHSGGPMMTQAATDEDGVSWIDDTGGTENVAPMESSNLTPAEVNNFGTYSK